MTSKGNKVLDLNQYQTSDIPLFIIYADLECLIEKNDGCKNNPENSSTTKVSKFIPSGFSISTISLFKALTKSMIYAEVKIVWKSFANL